MTRIGEIDNNPIAAESERRDKRFKKAWTEYTYLVNEKLKKERMARADKHLAIENLPQTDLKRTKLKATSRNRRTQLLKQQDSQMKISNGIETEAAAAIGVKMSRKRNAARIDIAEEPTHKKFRMKFGSDSELRIDETKLRECGPLKYKIEIKCNGKKAIIRERIVD